MTALSDSVVRRFPHPYRAALAICSDLDETPDRQVYFESMRYLNTSQSTSMGPGVDLEIGNTLYFDMPPDQFAYWNTDDAGRAAARALIRSGHIDCFHSFGDLATTRQHAERALDELARHDCRIKVWVDHGTAVTNFGADIMQGSGDVRDAAAYHADLTCAYGVRYVWVGRVTSILGQNTRRRWSGILRGDRLAASAKTLGKEMSKYSLSRFGAKYAMHGPNELMRPALLRDGQAVTEFLRCNPHWGGVSSCDTAAGFADVATESMLRSLVEREGYCVLYTHLGKVRNPAEPFGPATRQAFERIARYARQGKLLVTTTRRLLDYAAMHGQISVDLRKEANRTKVMVTRRQASLDLSGLTIHVDDASMSDLYVDGRLVSDVLRHPADRDRRSSVMIPWRRLEFPEF